MEKERQADRLLCLWPAGRPGRWPTLLSNSEMPGRHTFWRPHSGGPHTGDNRSVGELVNSKAHGWHSHTVEKYVLLVREAARLPQRRLSKTGSECDHMLHTGSTSTKINVHEQNHQGLPGAVCQNWGAGGARECHPHGHSPGTAVGKAGSALQMY